MINPSDIKVRGLKVKYTLSPDELLKKYRVQARSAICVEVDFGKGHWKVSDPSSTPMSIPIQVLCMAFVKVAAAYFRKLDKKIKALEGAYERERKHRQGKDK